MPKNKESRYAASAPERKRAQQRHTSPQIRADVTAERIAESVSRDSTHCMIAEAIREAYPGFTGITVDLATIRFSDPAKQLRYTYLTPRECQEPLIYFDQGVVPEPFPIILRRAAIITRSGNWGSKRTPTASSSTASSSTASSSTASSSTPKLPPLGPARGQRENGGGGTIPTVIGGLPPPIGPLLGRAKGRDHTDNGAYYAPGNIARRRKFGIKMLRY